MTNTDQLISQRLAASGVRYSSGRRAVIATLSVADGPISPAQIFDSAEHRIPLSSLYRSLAVLVESGVIRQHHGVRGLTRYELAEWLTGHHHHLVCVSCGTVDDIAPSADVEEQLESVVASLTSSGRFFPRGHALEIEGFCGACA